MGVASLLLSTAASFPKASGSWSEPIWLLVWGGVLIGASVQLRVSLSRSGAKDLRPQLDPETARTARTPSQRLDLPLLGQVRPRESVF